METSKFMKLDDHGLQCVGPYLSWLALVLFQNAMTFDKEYMLNTEAIRFSRRQHLH